ncbi:MAG: tRNA lysidine(34) synthetase TilS [Candidatus Xenobium sp.]|jgi:tRNA(Ile)-lysidine synthase
MTRATSGFEDHPEPQPSDQQGTKLPALSPLAERLRLHLHQTSLIPAGSHCLVALSGGGDSVALLLLLVELRHCLGLSLTAAHLDHGLRQESGADRDFVRDLCRRLRIPLTCTRADIRELAVSRNLSIEVAGRKARYRFLRRTALRSGCQVILTGHTADDQAETILLRLVSGTGLRGLAGIQARRRDGVVRPLLPFTRQELRDWLTRAGHPWREDPTNQVADAPRTRIRLLLMPMLKAWNPKILQALGRLAQQAREDEVCLDGLARPLLRSAHRRPEALILGLPELQGLEPPVRWRALRRALTHLGCRLEARHRDLLEDLLSGPSGRSLDLPGGRRARLLGRELHLEAQPSRPPDPPPPASVPVEPGRIEIPDWNLRLELICCEEAAPPGPWEIRLDSELLDGPLEVRSRRPGDRFRPAGGAGQTTLKKFLHGLRISKEDRDLVPLLCHQDHLVWIIGYRAAEDLLATPHSRRILRIRATPLLKGARAEPPKGRLP